MKYSGVTLVICGLLAGPGIPLARGAGPIDVTRAVDATTFLQLASSGRKNIAASNEQTGIVWESAHNGSSAVHVAFKAADAEQFGPATQLSDGDAFSPVIARCGDSFYTAWIEEGAIRASRGDDSAERVIKTADTEGDANEVSIGCKADHAMIAYSSRMKDGYRIYAMRFTGDAFSTSQPVAPADPYRFQTNPGITSSQGRVIVTWHDRSTGTNLLYATSGETLETLDKQVQVNELIKKSYEWGSGSSAVRSTLANVRDNRLAVVWLDKRSSRTGYKVYSAFSHDGGVTWGDNYLVSDEWGDIVPAWTPAIASDGNRHSVAVWMDEREDEKALWLSELSGLSWGQNRNLYPDASEPHSPVITYSPDGHLHAAWIESPQGQSAVIRYRED